MDVDTSVTRNDSSKETEQDISKDLPGPIILGKSCIFHMSESDEEGSLRIIKSGMCDENIKPCAVPHKSLIFVNNDNYLHSLDTSINLCMVQRASLIFSTAVDDFSFYRLDYQEIVGKHILIISYLI